MRLTLKLLLAALVGITVVQALNGYLRVDRELRLFETDLAGDLRGLGRAVAIGMERAWDRGGEEEARIVLDEMRSAIPHFDLRWVPHANLDRALAAMPNGMELHKQLAAGEPVTYGAEPNSVRETRDRIVVVAVPVRPDGDLEGVVEIAGSLKDQQDYVDRSIITTLAAAAGTLAATALILFIVGAWFVRRPTSQLISGASRIGRGDLDTVISLPQRDELGRLAAALDQMRGNLAAARARVESEVAARTEAQVRAEIERERRKEAVDQLRHADRLAVVGRLASSLVHELGAPLQVIAGRARMIERDSAAPAQVMENARIAREQSERITQIVRRLLDFSRKGGKPGDRAVVTEVVQRTTQLLEPIAEHAKVNLVVDAQASDRAPVVRGDAAQLQQVLVNLAINAVHAMPDGGTLTVRSTSDGERARIDVEDTGVGMSDETKRRLFVPFFTTKPPGQGTGLGLCVADEIVKSCGGTLRVESEVGKGSRFTVELPLA